VALARAVMDRKGMVAADPVALQRVENRVDGAPRRREGRTVERVAHGRALGWKVAAVAI
jgi:hypothetical protein